MSDTAHIITKRLERSSGSQWGGVAASPGRPARLVLVTCSDMGRLDAILRPAITRLDRSRDAILLEPVGTATLPAGGGARVRPSAFDAIAASGELVLAWQEAGRRFGYDASLLRALQAGLTVIAPARAGCNIDEQARNLCPQLTVVHVEPGTAALRSSLCATRCDVRLRDVGDLPSAVRALSDALRPFMPQERIGVRLGCRRTSPSFDSSPKSAARARRDGRSKPTTANLRSARRAPRQQMRATSPT